LVISCAEIAPATFSEDRIFAEQLVAALKWVCGAVCRNTMSPGRRRARCHRLVQHLGGGEPGKQIHAEVRPVTEPPHKLPRLIA
jgi:hypothetical protein